MRVPMANIAQDAQVGFVPGVPPVAQGLNVMDFQPAEASALRATVPGALDQRPAKALPTLRRVDRASGAFPKRFPHIPTSVAPAGAGRR